jgi:serine/threonine protein kinase
MHSQGVVHGDLKGVRVQRFGHAILFNGIICKANILVDQSCRALLADFGLVAIVSDSTTSNSFAEGGSTKWMSPELLEQDGKDQRRTEASDCYALGMVIYEILSRQQPFGKCASFAAAMKVLKGERPGRLEGVLWFTDDVWEVLERCWASLPQDRPGVEDVLKFMEKAASSWTPPPFLSTAVPSPVSSATSIIINTTSEQIMDVDEGKVSSPSQPSDNPPPMDGTGSNNVHAPAHGFPALLHEAPDHQDLRGDVGDPGGLTLSTPPPANEEVYSQRDREPYLEDLLDVKSYLGIHGEDLWMRDHNAVLEIAELECHLGIHNPDERGTQSFTSSDYGASLKKGTSGSTRGKQKTNSQCF